MIPQGQVTHIGSGFYNLVSSQKEVSVAELLAKMLLSQMILSVGQFNDCLHKEMGTSEKAYAFLLGIKNNHKDCVNQD